MSATIRAFLEAEAAYRAALEEVRELETARDDALLAASKETAIPDLSAATGISRGRVMRIVNRAGRRATSPWGFATRA